MVMKSELLARDSPYSHLLNPPINESYLIWGEGDKQVGGPRPIREDGPEQFVCSDRTKKDKIGYFSSDFPILHCETKTLDCALTNKGASCVKKDFIFINKYKHKKYSFS
jgi:hypothetical protein